MCLLRTEIIESFVEFYDARKCSNNNKRLDRMITAGIPKMIKKLHQKFATNAKDSMLNYYTMSLK